MKKSTFLILSMAVLLTVNAKAQDNSKKTKGQFERAEVVNFEVKEGVEFPQHYLTTMNAEIVAQLQAKKRFKEVVAAGGSPSAASNSTLRVTGVVTKFKAGNRTTRYLVGFGAGKTKIVAHVKFINGATGETVLEKDVDGKVVIGMFGGESIGATRGLAKEIAKVAVKTFF